ncbi:MAG: hypothetical protein CL678_08265 [Bdellovibrionaceae bacterium]|nr:hypothetical protein [Pseudobdellovibrionaceae bacterium]
MVGKPQGNNALVFEKYLKTQTVLVADSNHSSRSALARNIITLGAKPTSVSTASTYDDAVTIIEKKNPSLVLCDYDLGGRSGLELLQTLRKMKPEMDKKLFVLVTGNSSQSAVAQAAEEDVDTFILRPYTLEVLTNSLMRAAMEKFQPSPYRKTILEGKDLLFKGEIDPAVAKFEEAIKMDPKPALAYFYIGQADFMKEALQDAQGQYSKGLELNKIHYKCLTGLFDLLMKMQQYNEAYDVVKRVSRYFPANPDRLTQVLRLAIMTKNYDDIERYYKTFINMDVRNDELIRYVCAALVVCGKYYLQTNHSSRAMTLFTNAAVTGIGRVNILREIILTLCEHDMHKKAEDFLSRFPDDQKSDTIYLSLEYLVSEKLSDPSNVVEQGRKLIDGGHEDLLIYQVLIRTSNRSGLNESAQKYLEQGSKKYPEQKDLLQRAFDSSTPAQ